MPEMIRMPGSEPRTTLPVGSSPGSLRASDADAKLQIRSPWTARQKIARVGWMLVRGSLFRWSFHNWYGWRRFLLRCFGARVGHDARLRPTVMIEIPSNLELGDHCRVGDHAILYSLGKIRIGRLAVISQYAQLVRRHARLHAAQFPAAADADHHRRRGVDSGRRVYWAGDQRRGSSGGGGSCRGRQGCCRVAGRGGESGTVHQHARDSGGIEFNDAAGLHLPAPTPFKLRGVLHRLATK